MTVFKFSIHYGFDDYEKHGMQYRFVVAENEDEAYDKLFAHYEKLHAEGYAMPYICKATVEIDEVII